METISKIWINLVYIPFVWAMQYLDMDGEVLGILAILLVIDLITGWSKTVSLGEKPKSRRLAKGIIAKSVLILIPLVMALGFKGLHIDTTAVFYVVIDALILSETYSIVANIYTIRTGKFAEEYEVISKILKLIRTMLDKLLGD